MRWRKDGREFYYVGGDVAPDGQSFAVSVPAQAESRSILNRVLNWNRELQSSK